MKFDDKVDNKLAHYPFKVLPIYFFLFFNETWSPGITFTMYIFFLTPTDHFTLLSITLLNVATREHTFNIPKKKKKTFLDICGSSQRFRI